MQVHIVLGRRHKGVMYLGMYKAFEDHFELRQGKSFQRFLSGIKAAGTSIGSLFALALYLNLSYDDLMEIARRVSRMQSLIRSSTYRYSC